MPAFSASATAALVASGAAKGSLLAKVAGALAAFTAVVGPLTSLLSGYAGVRASLNVMRSPRERSVLFRQVRVMAVGAVVLIAALLCLILPVTFWVAHPFAVIVFGSLVSAVYGVWLLVMITRYTKETRSVRAEEERRRPELFHLPPQQQSRTREYRSQTTLLGIPLVHVRYAPPASQAGPAFGWIAVGDRAVGILFALGAMAAGGVSVGSVSAGVVAVGGVSVGIVSLGGVALGLLALGSLATGVVALGAFSLGWTGAAGAIGVARDYALGRLAIAEHANDAAATAFAIHYHLSAVFYLLLVLVFVLAVGPVALLSWRTRRRESPTAGSV